MGAYLEDPPGSAYGTEGNDYLLGTDGGQFLYGYGGDDQLRAFGGGDLLKGGDGNDTLEGGAGNDRLDGGLHNDTADYFNSTHGVIANLGFGTARTLGPGPVDDDILISIENLNGSFYDDHFQGSELHNRLEGNAGNDVLMGWGGDDLLNGGFGQDFIVGGEGRDRIGGGFDTDTLQGNNGIDTVDYAYAYQGMNVSLASGTSSTKSSSYYTDSDYLSGFENIAGSYYDDMLEGDGLENVLEGREGNDDLRGGAGADRLNGGAGIDTVNYRFSSNVVGVDLGLGRGTLGDASRDTYIDMENIYGSDHAAGDLLGGNDINNWIEGNGGNDVIRGRGGHDTLQAGHGTDFVEGGEGDDLINGGDGGDRLDGGAGFDTASFVPSFGGIDPVGPGVVVDLRAGTASGLGNDGERLFNIEGVIGTVFDDNITGNEVRNTIRGGLNQDTIRAGAGGDWVCGDEGNDVIQGGAGNDDLIGGKGIDIVTGGTDADRFIFRSFAELGNGVDNRDRIQDFVKGEDIIDLSGVDANRIFIFNQSFTYIDGDAFTGVAQLRSVVAGGNTIIEGNVDKDRLADFQIQLAGQIDLSALDFVL